MALDIAITKLSNHVNYGTWAPYSYCQDSPLNNDNMVHNIIFY